MSRYIVNEIYKGIFDDRNDIVLNGQNDCVARIDVCNKKTNQRTFIVITDQIFFETLDGEEYYSLNNYQNAIVRFMENLNQIVIIQLNVSENKEIVNYSFYGDSKSEDEIVELIKERMKNGRFEKVESFIATDFYGDYIIGGKFTHNEIIMDKKL